MLKHRFRLTVNVTHEEYSHVIELSRKVKTSPSALMQHAMRKLLADAENALPLIPAASDLPEDEERRMKPYATFFIPAPERD